MLLLPSQEGNLFNSTFFSCKFDFKNRKNLEIKKITLKDVNPKMLNITSEVCLLLQLVATIFYQYFIFYQMTALQKLWKMFFISPKKLFLFSRYLNFCIFIFKVWWHCIFIFKGVTLKLSIDRELNKEHFYRKIIQKICTKS